MALVGKCQIPSTPLVGNSKVCPTLAPENIAWNTELYDRLHGPVHRLHTEAFNIVLSDSLWNHSHWLFTPEVLANSNP